MTNVKKLSQVRFPKFSGTRVMMMPFHIQYPVDSLPAYLKGYGEMVRCLKLGEPGIGYLTVDEVFVKKGETHRRPGLHVDGYGSWGGGGGWGGRGMILASTMQGCRAWQHESPIPVDSDGGLDHAREHFKDADSILMEPNTAYWCAPMAVHESIPQYIDWNRQFVRISMPNDFPWFEGYTENPFGIKPEGPILPARTKQMHYRP